MNRQQKLLLSVIVILVALFLIPFFSILFSEDESATIFPEEEIYPPYQIRVTGGGSGTTTTTTTITGTNATLVGLTAGDYNGQINFLGYIGYDPGNHLCANEYADSHVCTTDEILNTIDQDGVVAYDSQTAWVLEGAPGYFSNSNDCNGLTSDNAQFTGAFWLFGANGGGAGWLTTCANTKPLACCS